MQVLGDVGLATEEEAQLVGLELGQRHSGRQLETDANAAARPLGQREGAEVELGEVQEVLGRIGRQRRELQLLRGAELAAVWCARWAPWSFARDARRAQVGVASHGLDLGATHRWQRREQVG